MSVSVKSNLASDSNSIQQNRLLAALPYEEWKHWAPDLEPVDMPVNEVLCEPGIAPAYMFFPTTAVVSLSYTTQDGASSEIAVVGNDGVVGISLFMLLQYQPGL